MIRAFLLCFAAFASLAMGPWKDCGGDVACDLGGRSYHVLEPDDWDGQTALPVLLHFHGWGRQGDLIVKHGRIAGHTRRRGVLLVAPNGQGRTWDFWRSGGPDVPFAQAVLADVAERYPIDAERLYVSGYSYGSAMAWRFACEAGDRVAALLAVSGSIDQTEECAEAPREVRHVHGLKDTVMRFPMGPGGDTAYPVALWRGHFGCDAARDAGTYNIRDFLTLSRRIWDCDGGRVVLDVHPGGHFIPHGWLGWQIDQLEGRAPRYP